MAPLSIVVVPARDEAEHIGACLEALADQTVGREYFSVILIADACGDDTAARAREAATRLGLRLEILAGPGQGAGAARRLGMDAAAERLRAARAEDGLIACTDADSRPRPDWLERQLAHVRTGAAVVAGTIELDPDEATALPPATRARRERDAARRLSAVRDLDAAAEHHHFAGASLGITARAYLQVGGLEPLPALEDAAFARRLRAHGIPIRRSGDVRVRTSARLDGRAGRGLAVDMAVSSWLERRRYRAEDFPLRELLTADPRRRIAVIIPTRDCAATIAGVIGRTVGPFTEAGLIDDCVVVDAASADGTAERAAAAGARVLQQDELLPDFGPALGKGDAMWRALAATEGDLVCFLDGDTADPHPRHLQGLLGPLIGQPKLVVASTAVGRGPRLQARCRAKSRPAPPGGGEVPRSGNRT